MLTGDVKVVQEDWKLVLEKEEEFHVKFYEHLFQLDPDLKYLFKRSMRMQGRKVISMFDTAIQKLDQPLTLLPPLLAAGTRHLQYNVKDSHYVTMRDAFIETIAEFLGDSFTSEKEQAWRNAFDLITEIMITGHGRGAIGHDSMSHGAGY